MLTRHFLNTLVTFLAMIVLGLLGVFLASYFDKKAEVHTDTGGADIKSEAQVAQ